MDWLLFAVFLFACSAAATTGALFEPGAWYRSLAKPRWTPPDWLFPVAWMTLYVCMSLAAMRVALAGDSGLALALWSAQIAFNTLWTPVFFGLKRMGAALGVMVGLWSSVAATMVAFWQIDLVAGLLFVPYLAWVTVAGALNFSVWRLNRGSAAAAA
ncbi:MAG: tryptophan-rich sensory protein TspO [Alkalilacustris sp.]